MSSCRRRSKTAGGSPLKRAAVEYAGTTEVFRYRDETSGALADAAARRFGLKKGGYELVTPGAGRRLLAAGRVAEYGGGRKFVLRPREGPLMATVHYRASAKQLRCEVISFGTLKKDAMRAFQVTGTGYELVTVRGANRTLSDKGLVAYHDGSREFRLCRRQGGLGGLCAQWKERGRKLTRGYTVFGTSSSSGSSRAGSTRGTCLEGPGFKLVVSQAGECAPGASAIADFKQKRALDAMRGWRVGRAYVWLGRRCVVLDSGKMNHEEIRRAAGKMHGLEGDKYRLWQVLVDDRCKRASEHYVLSLCGFKRSYVVKSSYGKCRLLPPVSSE